MCGIAGYAGPGASAAGSEPVRRMLASIRHRGPDEFGAYYDGRAALGSARLSILDLTTGTQPICNEDGTLWIVYNGEVFNHPELREGLEARGHRFTTRTDTEVILHLYEELGPRCLEKLNGQFAIAIWDTRSGTLFLARDRMGIRPLFYTNAGGTLVFASEIKALLAYPGVSAEIDPLSLDQIFVLWSTLPGRTIFRNIREVPSGHYLLARAGSPDIKRYWDLEFPGAAEQARSERDYLDEFRELLVDATLIRLRADVPVGAYLSGGLDSSTIAAIIRKHTGNRLETFSIAFGDPAFDESAFQMRMARYLGTDHHVIHAQHADIARVFPDVVWHTETPVMRTAPAPMFLLSGLVRERGFKVVLTGEGADEMLAGYDIFKEAAIRRFWARRPESAFRPLALKRLYADIPRLSEPGGAWLAAFFREGLEDVANPAYSHAVRWRNNSRTRRFFSPEVLEAAGRDASRVLGEIPYPPGFMNWGPLERAQYLESAIFLSQYLLSSQGDRPAMAHSVEGRMPFLDYRVAGFAGRLPARLKLRTLTEKYLLRQVARDLLPEEIWRRPKRPYRAPIHRSFFHGGTPEYVDELLSPRRIQAAGLFRAEAVARLVQKIRSGSGAGETDDMAVAGIISTQLVHHLFVTDYRAPAPVPETGLRLCLGREAAASAPTAGGPA